MAQQDSSPNSEQDTLYEQVGGLPFFTELVERFYKLVEVDSVLRPLYPGDLGPGKVHLARFLAQYWGGPPQYSLERGHPRLRRRHMPFPIGQAERDAWVHHMTSAVRSTDISRENAELMTDYFENTATLMMNRQ